MRINVGNLNFCVFTQSYNDLIGCAMKSLAKYVKTVVWYKKVEPEPNSSMLGNCAYILVS